MSVVVPVPEWRWWKTGALRTERSEKGVTYLSYLAVPHLPVVGRNIAAFLHELALKKFKREICECDVILASWLYPDGVAAARLGKGLDIPVWIQVLGSDVVHLRRRYKRSVIQDASDRAAGVICVAQHLKDVLVSAGLDAGKISVVRNGVDAGLFKPIGIRPRSNEVLWIGNLVSVKDPEAMLEVWAALKRRDLKLVFIGDGILRRRLERMATKIIGAGPIEFLGAIPPNEVAERIDGARVLCLTSRSEGMPNVVLEALASGLPVVASNVGAISEMLCGCELCRVVDREGEFTRSFADAIRTVVDADVDRLALSGRYSSRTWDTVADEVLELMK